MKVVWPRLGIGAIDQQHEGIFERLQELLELVKQETDRRVLREKMRALEERFRQHFRMEEDIMAECDYPDRAPHRAQHEEFLRGLSRVNTTDAQGGPATDLDRYDPQYILVWFINHLHELDYALSLFLADQKETLTAQPPPNERRRHSRLFIKMTVELRVEEEGDPLLSSTRNVSVSGLHMDCPQCPDDLTERTGLIKLLVHGEKDAQEVIFPCRVKRIDGNGAGVEFTAVVEEDYPHFVGHLLSSHSNPKQLQEEIKQHPPARIPRHEVFDKWQGIAKMAQESIPSSPRRHPLFERVMR